ncbi:D-alanyl-D-alanine carboxypeptidase family protein [Streptomyces pathocidini]|uniref:D-alanyl-D-alanine carboxypeptidase family protein n=2 Tax=Streptomyces pathocidini TaxID=1650571 RepID=A0ABW7UUB2_9ACTN
MDTMSGRNTRIGAAAAAAAVCLAVAGPAAAPAYADGHGQHHAAPAPAAAGGPLLNRPGVQVLPRAGAPRLPENLSARSWMVTDARTGEVLAAKDAHWRLAPASTLKTLFAVTVLPRLPQSALHQVSAQDLAGMGEGSSKVGIQPGKRYAVSDLWHGVFLSSGNDAVRALAAMNGSMPLTVRQMQDKASDLGARDTHVVSADGYDAPGQVSSAYDLSLFALEGLSNPDFVRYSSTGRAMFPMGRKPNGEENGHFQIQNTNRLLVGAPGLPPYPGLIGVKNGYTSRAGNTLVAAARRDGRTLVTTVMNPGSGIPNAVYHEAAALLDWGFDSVGRVDPVAMVRTPRTAGGGYGHAHHGAPGFSQGVGALPWAAGSVGALALVGGVLGLWRRRRHARGGVL